MPNNNKQKSAQQIYKQATKCLAHFMFHDWDEEKQEYVPNHDRIIDAMTDTLHRYTSAISKHFGNDGSYMTNEQYSTPVSKDIYTNKQQSL